MPQSYDFIFISARDFWEKLRKKLEIAFVYVTGQGSICHDEKVAYRPFLLSGILHIPPTCQNIQVGRISV